MSDPNHHDGDAPVPSLPVAASAAGALQDRPAAFFNALLTEQFVLESARGITVSESSSRASLYLATLSSALVGFGFLASTRYAGGYLAAIVPVVVLLGVFTYERLVQTSLEDVVALAAIQRIRRFHAGLLPDGAHYFSVPASAGAPNELLEIGQRGSWRGVFFTVSSAVGVVNSLVSGIGITLVLLQVLPSGAAVGLGAAAAILLAVLHGLYQERRYAKLTGLIRAQDALPATESTFHN